MNRPSPVQDKKAEIGISLSNLIQALLLTATIGFGSRIVVSIDTLTEAVANLTTVTKVNAVQILHNGETIKEHIVDKNRHRNME